MTEGLFGLFRCLFLSAGMLLAAWTDWKVQKIPNRRLVIMLSGGIFLAAAEDCMYMEFRALPCAAAGFLIGGCVCLSGYLLTGGGIGAGDVKLFAVAGCYLGCGSILRVLADTMVLAGAACIGLLTTGKVQRKQKLPLSPFAAVVVMRECFFRQL